MDLGADMLVAVLERFGETTTTDAGTPVLRTKFWLSNPAITPLVPSFICVFPFWCTSLADSYIISYLEDSWKDF
jgi:hypothetical protein